MLFTARTGGSSTGPYQGLNLAHHVGDDPGAVDHNRRLIDVFTAQNNPVTWMDQVHGRTIGVIGRIPATIPGPPVEVVPATIGSTSPATDALVACGTGIPVGVLVADCVPLIMVDLPHRIVAAVHAGRRGAAAGIAESTFQVMAAVGARPDTTAAFIGPSARGCCYEVDQATALQVEQQLPGSARPTSTGAPGLDLAAGLHHQLSRLDVKTIEISDRCTICDTDYFSYRRAHTTGRQAGVVWIGSR
ncbi:peptidoglycan editing factor PgeF [Corynebacterium sp. CCM 8862]|uniref:Purine nucleoside phosphorylase n=1 Tax=Corynebacterium mendelii TaxID=2765362 RepID=A0A939DYC4_9CORY|nr:peptidoglycan editing factor PgeF [Corynebacterium mendelii]